MTKKAAETKTAYRDALAAVEARLQLLRTQVASVAQGYTSALFVFGPGGLGKTHHVTSELEAIAGKNWKHHTAYSTPKALMMSIAESPDVIHLFEDCEKLYKTDVAASILRAACGSPKQKDRWVTYETAHEKLRVRFTGGVIVVSNEDISRSRGPLAAVASRFRPVSWNLSLVERSALILQIAKQGWAKGAMKLTPEQCGEVARFLVDQLNHGKVAVPVDLRTFTEHALPAYCQWKAGSTVTSWKDVILSKLQGSLQVEETRDQKSDRLRILAASISGNGKLNTKQKVCAWKEKTGLGQSIFYRHAKEAKRGR